MLNRFFYDLLLFLFALIFPWQIGAAWSIYPFFVFDSYYELIFFGLLLDILYGFDRPVIFIISILLYIILRYIKKYLRPYA